MNTPGPVNLLLSMNSNERTVMNRNKLEFRHAQSSDSDTHYNTLTSSLLAAAAAEIGENQQVLRNSMCP